MNNKSKSFYQICRERAGLTQEQAVTLLQQKSYRQLAVRTLSAYENGANVPDEIVVTMAEEYGSPLLELWHVKENTPYFRWLPEVQIISNFNELGFITIIAKDEVEKSEKIMKSLVSDYERDRMIAYEKSITNVIGYLFSILMYLRSNRNRDK